jgi:hypothetical protein
MKDKAARVHESTYRHFEKLRQKLLIVAVGITTDEDAAEDVADVLFAASEERDLAVQGNRPVTIPVTFGDLRRMLIGTCRVVIDHLEAAE